MSLQDYIAEQYIGQDKSKQQILDDIYKSAKDAWKDKIGYIPLKPMALITVHNPNSSIIESIGFSEPEDLLTNIFGAGFAGMLNSGGTVEKNLTDENGIVRTLKMNDSGGDTYARSGNTCGCVMRVGRGGTILKSDFNLTDPFVAVPENGFFNVTPGGWNSGNQQVIVNGLLASVTSSDTIGECGLFCRWFSDAAGTAFYFLLSHDAAGASFNSGQNINVTYTWSIT